MRLQKRDIDIIKKVVKKYIKDARIILFGSRTDERKRGGDIDLLILTDNKITLKEELMIVTDFEMGGIERKVDLLIKTPYTKESPIYQTAIKTGIEI